MSEFSIQLRCLKFIGFGSALEQKHKILLRFLQRLNILIIFYCLFAEILFVVQNLKDIYATAECLSFTATELITCAKIITFYCRNEKFDELLTNIKEMANKVDSINKHIIAKANQRDKRLASLYFFSVSFTGIAYCMKPIAINLINYHGNFTYEMPMQSAFFYDITMSPAYEVTYGIFCYGTYCTALINVAVDSLFFGCCLNICAHFDILRKLFESSDKEEFIKYHQTILNLSSDLNDIVKPVVFAQFLITSLLLCVIGFQLVMVEDMFKKIVALVFGLAIIIQLFIYSFGGQQIMDKSLLATSEIYQADKDYNLVILRSKRPLKIDAGFYHACLPTFRAILSSAASLMTLLKSFVEN